MRAFTSARVRVDQLIEYRTSVHGERLAQGDTKVAVCSSCHGSHDILPATDPRSRVHPLKVAETCGQCHADPVRMEGYTVRRPGGDERPLSTDQLARYRESVHHEAMVERGDLSAPTCNDCHGNHGATPPEVRSVSTVCAQCHSRPAELFAASELRVEVDQQGYPECAICHHQHAIRRPDDRLLAMLAAGESPSEWKPGPRWREVAAGFLRTISDLEARIARSGQQVDRAERYGMDLTRARLRLNQAQERLIQARVAIHSFDSAQLGAIVDGNEEEEGGRALAAAASSLADDALAERSFRRYGLVVALLIIAALVGLLVLKIRAMESTT